MRILIVEDERKIARALGRALKNEKYAVDILMTLGKIQDKTEGLDDGAKFGGKLNAFL